MIKNVLHLTSLPIRETLSEAGVSDPVAAYHQAASPDLVYHRPPAHSAPPAPPAPLAPATSWHSTLRGVFPGRRGCVSPPLLAFKGSVRPADWSRHVHGALHSRAALHAATLQYVRLYGCTALRCYAALQSGLGSQEVSLHLQAVGSQQTRYSDKKGYILFLIIKTKMMIFDKFCLLKGAICFGKCSTAELIRHKYLITSW